MKVFESLAKQHIEFIGMQKMFFVASAPLGQGTHVNLSPKGYDSFAILDNNRVAYVDFGGSGAETIAHMKENGRLTIMFTAFEGKPLILRLYGQGRAHLFGSEKFNQLLPNMPAQTVPVRAIIELDIHRVQESCGWSVPHYQYIGERETLKKYIGEYNQDDWIARRRDRNATSIDQLPAFVESETD